MHVFYALFSIFLYSQRVCYRTKVRYCRHGGPYYGCQLFPIDNYFKLGHLPTTGGNQSSVFIDSLNNTESNSLCFYNISVTENSSGNCSGMSLVHASDHPESSHIDRLEDANSSGNSTRSTPCGSYVRVSYTRGGRQQYHTLCREELAHLDLTLPDVTSVLIVYWTNNRESNSGSFKLQAQCLENL